MPSLRCACRGGQLRRHRPRRLHVSVSHPGRGHTDHDLIAVVTGFDGPVVSWGDLVFEDAVLVPGHGAVVDAAFVRGQQA